jgi:hypothetical protein
MNELVFKSTYGWNPHRIHALAIYCSDGRWGEAFDEFCEEVLQMPRYDRFALPGGPACLAGRDVPLLPHYDAAGASIDFLVRVHELERIILISHYGCALYAEILREDAESCLPAQEEDIRKAASILRKRFPKLAIDGYMAMRDDERVSFHQLEL